MGRQGNLEPMSSRLTLVQAPASIGSIRLNGLNTHASFFRSWKTCQSSDLLEPIERYRCNDV